MAGVNLNNEQSTIYSIYCKFQSGWGNHSVVIFVTPADMKNDSDVLASYGSLHQ